MCCILVAMWWKDQSAVWRPKTNLLEKTSNCQTDFGAICQTSFPLHMSYKIKKNSQNGFMLMTDSNDCWLIWHLFPIYLANLSRDKLTFQIFYISCSAAYFLQFAYLYNQIFVVILLLCQVVYFSLCSFWWGWSRILQLDSIVIRRPICTPCPCLQNVRWGSNVTLTSRIIFTKNCSKSY